VAAIGSFTGRNRRRTTSRRVVLADRVARGLITVGGIATIVQVLTVMVFLLWVALPLLRGARLDRARDLPAASVGAAPLHFLLDEGVRIGRTVTPDGRLHTFGLDDGVARAGRELFPGQELTASAFPVQDGVAAFGFADGSVRLATLDAGGEAGVVPREALLPPGGAAVRRLGVAATQGGPVLAVLTADGRLARLAVRERRNLLTGDVTFQPTAADLPYVAGPDGEPDRLLVTGDGRSVLAVWRDGTLQRFAAGPGGAPALAETVDLTPDGAALTALAFMNGGVTLIVGDARGLIRAWFLVKPDQAVTPDGAVLTLARELRGPRAAVTALGVSSRGRLFAAGFADGSVQAFHVTSGRRVAVARTAAGGAVTALALAPKDDALLAADAAGLTLWQLEARHPEASLAAFFAPVWYEGYARPAHVWQSSSATDESELKFGLWPLVFGTLKATLFSLLFGVPLALLAAIFTSEFLSPAVKAGVKPTIELMASLPSVVLGFLAAIVIAPFAERFVPAIVCGFVTVPAAFLTGALLWQLLPHGAAIRLGRWRFLPLALALPVGLAVAAMLGPVVERLLFAGDLKRWLDGQIGSATGGWIPLLLPAAAVATALALPRLAAPVRRRYRSWSRSRAGFAELLLTLLGGLAALALAVGTAFLLGELGLDPRGQLMGTYVQRNALVVGFVMGFAIIPIIYTIAEDALSSVPEHLRAASLGAGATPWQTAVRIVVPTAMSGLFSAVMIGLGRAVGETMIVLMAAGNTPVLEWNIFNGFRTLSANIAVEMPEAVRDSTHYRILFLSALVLFVMTFLLNTVAEIVRQRFRRRAFEL
jgi:phosphate transport system permease protein